MSGKDIWHGGPMNPSYSRAGGKDAQGFRILEPPPERLRTVAGGDADGSLHVYMVQLHVPSRRISAYLEVFFETDGDPDEISNHGTGSAWSLYGAARGQSGRWAYLHDLELAEDLPRAYELDSALRNMHGFVLCGAPQASPAATIPGQWYARARFEPNTPMDDEELRALFVRCGMTAKFLYTQ